MTGIIAIPAALAIPRRRFSGLSPSSFPGFVFRFSGACLDVCCFKHRTRENLPTSVIKAILIFPLRVSSVDGMGMKTGPRAETLRLCGRLADFAPGYVRA
jgi:hypothetical protein